MMAGRKLKATVTDTVASCHHELLLERGSVSNNRVIFTVDGHCHQQLLTAQPYNKLVIVDRMFMEVEQRIN